MKTRKKIAALLAVVLLTAMAGLTVHAASTLYYTFNYTFETADDLSDVSYAGVTVNTTDKVAELVTGGNLYKGFKVGIDAVEVELSVKRGSSTVRFTTEVTRSVNCFQVKVTPTGYTIYAENPAAGANARTVKTGTHDGSVVISYFVDAANNKVSFTVNGEKTDLAVEVGNKAMTETTIANSVTNFSCVMIQADATTGDGPHTTVTAVRVGPLTNPPPQTSNSPVSIKVHRTYGEATVYSIDLTYGNFDFTYTPAKYENYDPETHQYLNVTPAAWEGNDGVNNVICVTNRSNAAVQVDVTCYINSNLNGVTLDWDGDLNKTLASALDLKKPDSLMVTATVGGEPNKNYIDDGSTRNRIGAITVTVVPA